MVGRAPPGTAQPEDPLRFIVESEYFQRLAGDSADLERDVSSGGAVSEAMAEALGEAPDPEEALPCSEEGAAPMTRQQSVRTRASHKEKECGVAIGKRMAPVGLKGLRIP